MSTTESVVTIAADKLSSTVAVPEPPAPAPPPLSPPEPTVRNQAPGIPDRRKSLRPGKRESRGGRKSSGSKRLSVVTMASEMRIKDDDEDRQETFEDATSTPRPSSVEPQIVEEQAAEDGEKDQGGLGISGAETVKARAVESNEDGSVKTYTPKRSTSQEREEEEVAPEVLVREATAEEHKDEDDGKSSHSRQTTLESVQLPPPRAASPMSRDRSVSPSKVGSRQHSPMRTMRGLSGDLPIPTPPPSSADRMHALEQRQANDRVSSPPPPGPLRKASSGFGALLGRMGSIRKPARSPPAPRQESRFSERRGTSASAASDGLPIIHDGGKPSLQDQFTSLRRQEEFHSHEANGVAEDKQEDAHASGDSEPTSSPPRHERSDSTSGLKSPPLNPSLPPGTASGMSAGPAAEPREVNWDLWQQVVYEGPAAVARTSGEELNQAITSGIPPAIRGVVWQVLAESKNEELENIYRTLKARGTDAEHQRPPNSRTGSSVTLNGVNGDKEATSDASSEHSERSTTANSGMASPPTSVESNAPELKSKLLEEKTKRESLALQKLEKAIKRDMGSRTSYSKYTQSAGLQDGLFGVCKAYALFDEGVGYAQGINFIAMPLLFNMSEEEAFTLLVRLMAKYDLRSMFTPDMTGLHLRLYQFERLLEEYEPAVYCHLRRRNVGPQLYATQWFLTLFAYRFPLQLVLRIYDLILSEGLTAILKFGIVLMQHNRAALLEMKDMSQLTNFLKEKLFDVYIDKSPSASSLLDSGFFGSVTGGADKELYRADEMVRDACDIKISDETLARYTIEWEEQQRLERDRETELENLRTSNAALTTKVKGLEERVQQHDAEHVNIAQDLVKIKVENDSLMDQNEALKIQVEELQKLVDAQPAEIEQKLKDEMDRIMQRNIEVQNENRALKEEMDEMEHELVNAKMAHAQTQSDHDSLKQKWSSVQALLNERS
ncbi:hypothetical protein M409DRAFT_69637 [Zasmidium cellare ATCC 36951]|uniref:GTPase-activating protein GYP5 n=1 Tax=Zasmidium cellare ATCC 36951 TaxID=1080233 RepID=A0A6A6C4A4_ZASCE|nr:uncharacterized protein M409DRAFT_69637 [Zasmidium cellare ATCC 36951]KAF2161851.1 hypothetical protein M409DRAFT_69637 [Zasmidium cellare ATCC 36951]